MADPANLVVDLYLSWPHRTIDAESRARASARMLSRSSAGGDSAESGA